MEIRSRSMKKVHGKGKIAREVTKACDWSMASPRHFYEKCLWIAASSAVQVASGD